MAKEQNYRIKAYRAGKKVYDAIFPCNIPWPKIGALIDAWRDEGGCRVVVDFPPVEKARA